MKKLLIILFVLNTLAFAQPIKFGDAKGLFMAVGVGPRFPVSSFGDKNNIGVGFDVTFSYSDNLLMPIFLYGSLGFEHFPGRQDFYKKSDYSSFSSNVVVIQGGAKYYFSPIFDDVVLLMPIAEAGIEFAYFEDFHQFKIDKEKSDYLSDYGKFGMHAGVGISMFILDVVAYYNYIPDHQYISFVVKANIPIFVKM
jgi:hypothetical protein